MPFSIPQPPKQIEPALVSPRGAHLATRLFMPSSRSRHVQAICLIVSGEILHSGYFEGLAGRLNREGIAVVAYDTVCTGYSDLEPDAQPGCFHIDSIDCWVEDIFAAAVWARERTKASNHTPFFLLGESLGGVQVLAAALDMKAQAQHDVKLSGVIALGALIEPAPGFLPSRAIIKMLSLFSPCFPQLKLPAPKVSPNFDDAFGSREWALTARADPMVQIIPKPTLAAALSMINGAERIESRAKTLDLPLLAIHSVNDSRAVFAAVQKVVDRVGSKAECLWIEDTTGHQLLQDHREVTERVKEKIANWIVRQLQ